MVHIFLKGYTNIYREEQEQKQGAQLGGQGMVAGTRLEVAKMEEVNGFWMWIECGVNWKWWLKESETKVCGLCTG